MSYQIQASLPESSLELFPLNQDSTIGVADVDLTPSGNEAAVLVNCGMGVVVTEDVVGVEDPLSSDENLSNAFCRFLIFVFFCSLKIEVLHFMPTTITRGQYLTSSSLLAKQNLFFYVQCTCRN